MYPFKNLLARFALAQDVEIKYAEDWAAVRDLISDSRFIIGSYTGEAPGVPVTIDLPHGFEPRMFLAIADVGAGSGGDVDIGIKTESMAANEWLHQWGVDGVAGMEAEGRTDGAITFSSGEVEVTGGTGIADTGVGYLYIIAGVIV